MRASRRTESISSEEESEARLRVPIEIEERVVNGIRGVHLATVTKDAGDRWIVESIEIVADECWVKQRVAIKKKDKRGGGLSPAGIAAARSGSRAVENDGADAEVLCEGDGVISGSGVNIENFEQVARVVHGEH